MWSEMHAYSYKVLYVTVFAKRDHLGANLNLEFCIWSEYPLLPLYNALYWALVASSVSEIHLRKVWNFKKCVVEKPTFKHLLPVKLQHSVFFRVTEYPNGPALLLGHQPLHWILWKTSWNHRNRLRLFMRSCEDLKNKDSRSQTTWKRSGYAKLTHTPVDFGVSAHFRLSKQSVIISRRAALFIFAKSHHPVSRLCRIRHLEGLQTLQLSKSFVGKWFSGCEGYTIAQNSFRCSLQFLSKHD